MKRAEMKSVRRQRKNTRGYYVRVAVCVLVIGGFLYTLAAQQIRLMNIRSETARCEEEIALQEKEYERLKEKAEYSSSDKFYEEKARDEGYVLENETVFVVGN